MPKNTQKLYAYVDETGQDTIGALFIISIVVTGEERDALIEVLEQIEKVSGKGRVKWMEAKNTARLEYIKQVLKNKLFKNKLLYSVYKNTKEYLPRTVLTTARAITYIAAENHEATVMVDGLPQSRIHWFSSELRHLHIRVRKIRSIKREENDALLRLADALCGFARAGIESKPDFAKLFLESQKSGVIKEI